MIKIASDYVHDRPSGVQRNKASWEASGEKVERIRRPTMPAGRLCLVGVGVGVGVGTGRRDNEGGP